MVVTVEQLAKIAPGHTARAVLGFFETRNDLAAHLFHFLGREGRRQQNIRHNFHQQAKILGQAFSAKAG